MATNGTLTPRRRLFAVAMATGKTAPEAGALLGISERTAWRWADDTAIAAEVSRLQDAALQAVSAKLRNGAAAALGWLEAVGNDAAAPHAARVSAARAWLGGGMLDVAELVDLEARMAALEAATKGGDK